MSDKDTGNLSAILDACNKIMFFIANKHNADEFYEDQLTFDAVLMNFVVIGESVSRLSEDFKDANKDVPWIKIKGFRNIVVHDYFGVDAEEVWQIVQQQIPTLQSKVQSLLGS